MPKAKRECFTPMVLSDEMYREKWESVIYEGKEFSEDYPEIYSDRGERVRSKTEKIIADKLYKEGIPYRYEEPYKLDKYGIVYPDFKILDVNNRQEIILEHFGMMDDEDYTSKALKKIKMYERQGLVLGKNLMITYETSTEPFDSRAFERMLREYGVMGWVTDKIVEHNDVIRNLADKSTELDEVKQDLMDKKSEVWEQERKLTLIKKYADEMIQKVQFAEELIEHFKDTNFGEREQEYFDKMLDLKYENECLKRENQELKAENRTPKAKLEKAYDFMRQFTINGMNMLEHFLWSIGEWVQQKVAGVSR